MRILLMVSVVLGLIGAAVAQERPTFTGDTKVVAPGRVQLEAGYDYAEQGNARTSVIGEPRVRVGVTKNVEVRAGGSSYQVTKVTGAKFSGWQDSDFGVKVNLFNNSEGLAPRASVTVDTTASTGSRVFRNRYQPGARLNLGWDVTPKTAVEAMVGYRRGDGGAARFNQVTGGIAVRQAVTSKLGAFAEVFNVNAPNFGGSSHYANVGLTYNVRPDLRLDAHVAQGLNGVHHDFVTGVGVSKLF